MFRMLFTFWLAGTGALVSPASAGEPLHRLGLRYEDPRTIATMGKCRATPVRPGCPSCDSVDSIDLSDQMPPVGNQGPQGSCTAWAMGYYHKTHTEWLEHGWDVGDSAHQFSPAFIYNQVNGGTDQGSGFSEISELLCEMGCCNMVDFPYDHWNYTRWPSESAYAYAIPFRGEEGFIIELPDTASLDQIKQRLCNGYTTALGIWVWGNFDDIEQHGNVYCVADKEGSNRGGHAVCIVGYNDSLPTNDGPGAFRIANSWGSGWGDAGYFWMSYRAVLDEDLSQRGAAYVTDRIGYQPRLLARVKVAHPSRDRVGTRFVLGPKSWPVWRREYRAWRDCLVDRPFPDNNIVFDISEAESLIAAHAADSLFFNCFDGRRDSMSGMIELFSVEWPDSGVTLVARDTPLEIPDQSWIGAYSLILPFAGVEEMANVDCRMTNEPTVVRGRLSMPEVSDVVRLASSVLLDVSGRKLMELVPGENDVSGLAPGIYFAVTPHPDPRPEGERGPASGVGREASCVTRVVLVR